MLGCPYGREQGCPAAVRAVQLSSQTCSCSLWQSFSSLEGPSGNSSPCLCSWVWIAGLKTRCMSLNLLFRTPLIFTPECVLEGPPGSKCSSASCGRGWDRSSGNVRGWKCIWGFAVQNWFESVGRGRAGMCRSCSEGRMAEAACSSQKVLSSLVQLS